jgi:hypothetical protein
MNTHHHGLVATSWRGKKYDQQTKYAATALVA